MDNIGDYIWLIFAALYFLFGRGKKKKESPQRKSTKPRPSTNTPSLEDILRELSGEVKQKPAPEEIKPEPVPVPKAEHQFTGSTFERSTERRKIEIIDYDSEYSDTIDHDSDTGESLELIRQRMNEESARRQALEQGIDFDLRQAVIYDAIMNKPYE